MLTGPTVFAVADEVISYIKRSFIMNKVFIQGNLGQDVEFRYTTSGTPVANFSVATNEVWTDKQGKKSERTEWHRIVVYGKTAENCAKYLSKGQRVLLEGKIQTRKWTNKDGKDVYTTEIIVNHVQFLGGNKSSVTQKNVVKSVVEGMDYGPTIVEDDLIPF